LSILQFFKQEKGNGLSFKNGLNFYYVWSIYTAVQLLFSAV